MAMSEWRRCLHEFTSRHEFTIRRSGSIRFALIADSLYSSIPQTRGGAVWQLVGLITRRSQVQILSPQPDTGKTERAPVLQGLFSAGRGWDAVVEHHALTVRPEGIVAFGLLWGARIGLIYRFPEGEIEAMTSVSKCPIIYESAA
jgi:hypothetical protein